METPTNEELMERKKQFLENPNTETAYYLADCYYRGGSINAARVYARLWGVLLAVKGMTDEAIETPDEEMMFVNLMAALGIIGNEDPLVWMYG